MFPPPFAPAEIRWIPQFSGTIADNLSHDENLWRDCESHPQTEASFRLWEPSETGIILGRGSQLEREVDLAACQQNGISIHRRLSGGASVLLAPGCLTYTLIAPMIPASGIHPVEIVHREILAHFVTAFADTRLSVHRAGTSDLAFVDQQGITRKFSGNSLRLGRRGVLYHGTLLYDINVSLLSKILKHPPREPSYRDHRSHAEFVANLPLPRGDIVQRIEAAWHFS